MPRGEQPVQKDEREEFAAQPVKRRIFDPLDRGGSLFGRNVDQFGERSLGRAKL